MSKKRLEEMEEEVQILLIESDGVHTEKIKELCTKIDSLKEFIEQEKLSRRLLKNEN